MILINFFKITSFFSLCCLMLNCKINNQLTQQPKEELNCSSEYDTISQRIVYLNTDTMPVFQNGKLDVLKYFKEHLMIKTKVEFQGSVYFIFIIDVNGKPIGVRVKNKKPNQLSDIEKEGINILSNMPNWKPGKCNGVLVPVRVSIPIYF